LEQIPISSCKSLNPGYPDSDNKNSVLDQNQKPIAAQIPMTEFEQTDEILSKHEALKYLELLKNNHVES